MTAERRFIPLRMRQGLLDSDPSVLDEHVMPHMAERLWHWCMFFNLHFVREGSFGEDVQFLTARAHRMCLPLRLGRFVYLADFKREVDHNPDLLLDMVDWLLHDEYSKLGASRHPFSDDFDPNREERFSESLEELEYMLLHGGTWWTIANPPDRLLRRVPIELESEYARATEVEDPTSDSLRSAWIAAWRRDDPSPVEAYDGAVKAIENILAPIVIPKHPMPTLGRVADALRAKPDKWDTRFRGAETVTALAEMLNELWKTQNRHGGMRPNDLAQARDAVTIAVAIVALVRRDFLTLVDDSQLPNNRPTNSSTR